MINLLRTKSHKWIFQKNISSTDIFENFISITKKFNDSANRETLLKEMKRRGIYKGRAHGGSSNTMGVRTSEMKFYMFGYSLPESSPSSFFLTPMSSEMIKDDSLANKSKMALVNLFSMQYPSAFSKTPNEFKICAGRLIVKLLLDEKINKRLYIDEFCYFLPFLERIDKNSYKELTDSILEFRKLNFDQKDHLFRQVKDCDEIFSNVVHEVNYYFFRIFKGFGTFDIVGDKNYNGGHLHEFAHGRSSHRYDAFESRKSYSGYVKLSDEVLSYARKLNSSFSAFEAPVTLADEDIMSKEDFILELYQIKPMQYLSCIDQIYSKHNDVSEIISNMVHMSKYGSRDGKDFENSLKPVFELFKQTENVEIISGSGDTDLLCAMRDDNDDGIYKINVDAKTSSNSTAALSVTRLTNHLRLHGSKYCIVVSSRFARGASMDIMNSNIVAINAETLANYCVNGYNASNDGMIDYNAIDELIRSHLGQNITSLVQDYINDYFGC